MARGFTHAEQVEYSRRAAAKRSAKARDKGAVLERFYSKTSPEPNSGCWLWVGPIDRDGYGFFYVTEPRPGRTEQRCYRAHRFSYEAHIGGIGEGLELDHLCRVRCCVNPRHLEPVTNLENQKRSDRTFLVVNGGKTQCVKGHELSGGNVYHPPRRPHVRMCRACMREHSRQRKLKEKAARHARGLRIRRSA